MFVLDKKKRVLTESTPSPDRVFVDEGIGNSSMIFATRRVLFGMTLIESIVFLEGRRR
jgi:hypothetical protein